MKKAQLVVNILLVAGVLALGGYQILKKEKTVYVDVAKLMQEYRGMKDANAEFQKKSAQWQANADTLVAQFQQELKDYEKERSRMTSKEKELKEEILRNRQQQIGQYQEAIKMKAQEEQQLITQTAVNSMNDFIKAYGKKKGYTFIMGATGTGNILYASESSDITQIIVDGLNKEYDLDHPVKKE